MDRSAGNVTGGNDNRLSVHDGRIVAQAILRQDKAHSFI